MRLQVGFIAGAVVAFALAGCASSHVVVGTTRSPISVDQVKVYIRPPGKYEEVALLEASSRNSWAITSQGKINAVVERMKEEAAALGANGVLLLGTGSEYGGSVNTSSATATTSGDSAYGTGFGTSVAIVHKAGSGLAIYVSEE